MVMFNSIIKRQVSTEADQVPRGRQHLSLQNHVCCQVIIDEQQNNKIGHLITATL